jgi:hypothetical protein
MLVLLVLNSGLGGRHAVVVIQIRVWRHVGWILAVLERVALRAGVAIAAAARGSGRAGAVHFVAEVEKTIYTIREPRFSIRWRAPT